jgi:hypothetical protein
VFLYTGNAVWRYLIRIPFRDKQSLLISLRLPSDPSLEYPKLSADHFLPQSFWLVVQIHCNLFLTRCYITSQVGTVSYNYWLTYHVEILFFLCKDHSVLIKLFYLHSYIGWKFHVRNTFSHHRVFSIWCLVSFSPLHKIHTAFHPPPLPPPQRSLSHFPFRQPTGKSSVAFIISRSPSRDLFPPSFQTFYHLQTFVTIKLYFFRHLCCAVDGGKVEVSNGIIVLPLINEMRFPEVSKATGYGLDNLG